MKKHLRVLAAVLVLCFSLLCPAASAASVQTAACKPSTAAVQTISAGKKTEQMVWVPQRTAAKISQQVYLQQYERPGKGYIIESKSGRLHCLQKVLLRK